MKRDDRGFIRREPESIDPGVAATLTAGQQRQAEMQLTPAERALLAKAREKEKQRKAKRAARNRAVRARRADYLMDPAVIDWTQQQAEALGCSASQVAAFALRYLAGAVDAGTVDLRGYLSPTPAGRFAQRLDYPQTQKLAVQEGQNSTLRKKEPHSKK